MPHWPRAYGGRDVPLAVATAIADLLDDWRVPRTPRGSGLLLAAPAILAHAAEATKRRLLPPMVAGTKRWCQLLGARATGWHAGDDEVPGFIRAFLRTRANSIEGGTSEINRTIVGERVLGLPREPDPYKTVPWRDVPR